MTGSGVPRMKQRPRWLRVVHHTAAAVCAVVLVVAALYWAVLGRQRIGASWAVTRHTQVGVMPVRHAVAFSLDHASWNIYTGFEIQRGNMGIAYDPSEGVGAQIAKPRRWVWQLAGLAFYGWTDVHVNEVGPLPHRVTYANLRLPYWFLILVSSAVVAHWLVVRRRRLRLARAEANLCPACGYDLRATPQRCPECGRLARRVYAIVARIMMTLRPRRFLHLCRITPACTTYGVQ